MLVVLIGPIAAGILYLVTLMRCLERCAPARRRMSPGLVWLALIPLFNFIWNFFMVLAIADSAGQELMQRGTPALTPPGQRVGLTMAILGASGVVLQIGEFRAAAVSVVGIAGFIFWIVYWVRAAGFSKRLAANVLSVSA